MDRRERFKIRRYESLEAMKADEYKYWQDQPSYERLTATSEISTEAYRLKDGSGDVARLQRTIIHMKR